MSINHYLFLSLIFLVSCKNTSLVELKNEGGQVIEKYYIKKDSTLHGLKTIYYSNAIINIEEHYVDGKLHGARNIYDEDGNIEIKEQYNQDTIIGPYEVFYPDGSLKLKAQYIEGKMQGRLESFYNDGSLKEEVFLVDNEENGPFKEYHRNGKVSWEGTYVNGDNEIGLLQQYDEEGILVKKMQCDTFMNFSKCTTIWKLENKTDEE